MHVQPPRSVPGGYTLQHADENDIPLLHAVEAAAGAIFPSGFLPENVLAERVPRDVFMDAIAQGRLLVARNSGKAPVGYALWRTVDGCALLAQIDVDPPHGRKGLGTALVRAVLEQVEKAGFHRLYLTTFSAIPWNAPFYKRLGFVLLGDADQPDFIKSILAEESAKGLSNRAAMCRSIQSAQT